MGKEKKGYKTKIENLLTRWEFNGIVRTISKTTDIIIDVKVTLEWKNKQKTNLDTSNRVVALEKNFKDFGLDIIDINVVNNKPSLTYASFRILKGSQNSGSSDLGESIEKCLMQKDFDDLVSYDSSSTNSSVQKEKNKKNFKNDK